MRRLWIPDPWKCSRSGWMGFGAAWASGRCGTAWALRSLQPKPFHDSLIPSPQGTSSSLQGIPDAARRGKGLYPYEEQAPFSTGCECLQLPDLLRAGLWWEPGVREVKCTESELLRLEKSSQSTECHIQSFLRHLQGWRLQTSLDSPFQCLTTLSVKKFLLLSSLKLWKC